MALGGTPVNNQEMMQLLPELDSQYEELVQYCKKSGTIDQSLYMEYDVKRGLRDSNGKGVLTGLTEISLMGSRYLVTADFTFRVRM